MLNDRYIEVQSWSGGASCQVWDEMNTHSTWHTLSLASLFDMCIYNAHWFRNMWTLFNSAQYKDAHYVVITYMQPVVDWFVVPNLPFYLVDFNMHT